MAELRLNPAINTGNMQTSKWNRASYITFQIDFKGIQLQKEVFSLTNVPCILAFRNKSQIIKCTFIAP